MPRAGVAAAPAEKTLVQAEFTVRPQRALGACTLARHLSRAWPTPPRPATAWYLWRLDFPGRVNPAIAAQPLTWALRAERSTPFVAERRVAAQHAERRRAGRYRSISCAVGQRVGVVLTVSCRGTARAKWAGSPRRAFGSIQPLGCCHITQMGDAPECCQHQKSCRMTGAATPMQMPAPQAPAFCRFSSQT